MPSAEERDGMLTLMKESLRDSVLNDLHCSGNIEHPEHKEKQQVLKSLLRNGGKPHTYGPLRSLVVLKSDSFSQFAHCDENCRVVNAFIPVRFRWPDHMLELARHVCEEDSDEMSLRRQVLGKSSAISSDF